MHFVDNKNLDNTSMAQPADPNGNFSVNTNWVPAAPAAVGDRMPNQDPRRLMEPHTAWVRVEGRLQRAETWIRVFGRLRRNDTEDWSNQHTNMVRRL